MITKWNINEEQSDVLIKTKESTIAYLGGTSNHFKGFIDLNENGIENAAVEFSLDDNSFPTQLSETDSIRNHKIETRKKPLIRFKSTSFQKIKNNINFFKGSLTIKDITRVVELDAEFIGINNYNGTKKAAFEIKGNINRNDFGIDANFYNTNERNHFGKDLKLTANLEFSI